MQVARYATGPTSQDVTGYNHFTRTLRQIFIDYHETARSQRGIR